MESTALTARAFQPRSKFFRRNRRVYRAGRCLLIKQSASCSLADSNVSRSFPTPARLSPPDDLGRSPLRAAASFSQRFSRVIFPQRRVLLRKRPTRPRYLRHFRGFLWVNPFRTIDARERKLHAVCTMGPRYASSPSRASRENPYEQSAAQSEAVSVMNGRTIDDRQSSPEPIDFKLPHSIFNIG